MKKDIKIAMFTMKSVLVAGYLSFAVGCGQKRQPEEMWQVLSRKLIADSVEKVDISLMSYDRDHPPYPWLLRPKYDPFVLPISAVIKRGDDIRNLILTFQDSASYKDIMLASSIEITPDMRLDFISFSVDTVHIYMAINKWGGLFVAFKGDNKLTWLRHYSGDLVWGTRCYLKGKSKIFDLIYPYLIDETVKAAIDSIRARR